MVPPPSDSLLVPELPGGAHVKNTFLEFPAKYEDDDEDEWIIPLKVQRQWTDSIVERCSQSMQREQERSVACPQKQQSVELHSEEEEASSSPLDLRAGGESGDSTTVAEESSDENGDEEDNQKLERSAEMQAARKLAEMGGGLSGHTTVMIRHVACKYTQRKLMREINGAGFMGRFDFFYLPMDPRSHANRGFAFANFLSPDIAEEFYHLFHGQQLRHFNSDKVIAVTPADLQGFEANAAHYAYSRALKHKRAPKSRPLFFRPLPEDLLGEVALGAAVAPVPQFRVPEPQAQPFRFCVLCGQPRDLTAASAFCSHCWAPMG
mmetsp:Transcript_130065/g.277812  ORF Transcript_130065/g.277812 Transcript_130065/m.277812 type:complete len:321 (-) Transcript_130065:30-992(-)